MVRKPKVFLMDEPLSNLDAKLREHMRVELVRLHKSLGTTSIYVTHDQTEALTMATKIVLMNEGKIQQAGKPEEFYNHPMNLFVAKFIGSPTMNIFEGIIENGSFVSNNGYIRTTPSKEDSESVNMFEGKKVSIGIRSERFLTTEAKENVEVVIDVVEMLGKERILFTKLPSDDEIIISVPGHLYFEPGSTHKFGIDQGSLHFFDAETGERINNRVAQ